MHCFSQRERSSSSVTTNMPVICSKWMAANQPIIGGVGHIVQVDEAVISRAKYHRGRRVSPGIWMNICRGRDTAKPDQLPLTTFYYTSQRFTQKIAKISQIYIFFSNFLYNNTFLDLSKFY